MTHEPPPETLSADQAFDAMGLRLAGLTASVDGFAARQQELLARDYSLELGRIHDRCDVIGREIAAMKDRPAVALSPQLIADQIRAAGNSVREEDHQTWRSAQQRLEAAARAITEVTASAQSAQQQKFWLIVVAIIATTIGAFGGLTLPAIIAHSAPDNWHWPEKRAAGMLQRRGWEAGQRMLQVADPDGWKVWADAARISEVNREALDGCTKRAVKKRKAVPCTIKIPSSSPPG